MGQLKNLQIDKSNQERLKGCHFDEQRKRIIGKPVIWQENKLIENFEEYIGILAPNFKSKKRNYSEEIFNN